MSDAVNISPYRPDKLRLIRIAQGYSLDELGKSIEVTRQNIHKMEAGQEPTAEQLPLLCNFLDVTKGYFYSERNTPVVEEQCHFRSLRSRTKTLTNKVMARAELLDGMVRELENLFELPAFDLPDVTDLNPDNTDDMEEAAIRLRKYWGLENGPVDDITIVMENAGIIISTVDGVDEKVDAFSLSRRRPIVIRNSSKKSPCRYRFDLAHELGHLVMHDGIDTGCKETEKQANAFASAFLMPKSTFNLAVKKYPLTRGVRSLNWQSLYQLKLYFKVSFKALLYRAKSLGLLNNDQQRSGYIFLNKKGYSKVEPLDSELNQEAPYILNNLLSNMNVRQWNETLSKLGLTDSLILNLLPDLLIPKSPIKLV